MKACAALILAAVVVASTQARWYDDDSSGSSSYHRRGSNRGRNVLRMSASDDGSQWLNRLRQNSWARRRTAPRVDFGSWILHNLFNSHPTLLENNEVNIPTLAGQLGLSDLVAAVTKAGLAPVLSGAGPFTVFGPTNEAFTNLPPWAKEATKNITFLTSLLKYHVLSGEVTSKDLSNELVATTVEGRPIRINLYKNNTVATAQCAPIDLKNVDKQASNGVIHELKQVTFFPFGNIVQSLVACPAYKTLVKAAGIAGLVDTLSGSKPLTLFAPSDKAFAKIPPEVLKKLIEDPAKLKAVLLYHVVSGTFCSASLSNGSVTTVNGQDVIVSVSADGVKVNDANVVVADAPVTNGVVHAIDTVLLPPGLVL